MTKPEARLLLAGAFCAVTAIVGVVLYQTAPAVDFAWFAYSPNPPQHIASSTLSTQQIVGLAVTALGLAGAFAVAGFALGRRSRSR